MPIIMLRQFASVAHSLRGNIIYIISLPHDALRNIVRKNVHITHTLSAKSFSKDIFTFILSFLYAHLMLPTVRIRRRAYI